MPDVVTHATFARDLIDLIENPQLKYNLIKNKYILYLGAQGPDVFYFHQLLSIKRNKAYRNFGNVMHDEKAGHFLIESIKYLKAHYHVSLHSYLCGFISHHTLDRNVHPYVYHVTGKDNIKYRGNHVRLERAIDSWFIMNHWDEPFPHHFKIHKKILNYQLDTNIFSSYYNHILKEVYQKKNGGKAFLNASKNFRRYAKVIYDPFGLKKKLARFIDKYLNKKSKFVLETLCYYKNINSNIDYLNLRKKQWHHPVLNHIKKTDSFLDLYNKGLNEATKEIEAMNKYLKNEINLETLKTYIKDLSYSTGLLCSENNKMKYFNVIF